MICLVSSLYLVLAKLMQEQYTATHPHLEIMVRITWCSSSLLCMWDYKGKNTLPLNPHHEGAHREYHPQHVHVIWKCFLSKWFRKKKILPGVRSSLGASFLSSPWALAATTACQLIVNLAIMDQRCIFLATTAGNLTTSRLWKKQHIPEVRHICRSSLAAWGQLLLRSAALSSEKDLSK